MTLTLFDFFARLFPRLFRRRHHRRAITVTTRVVALDRVPKTAQFTIHTPRSLRGTIAAEAAGENTMNPTPTVNPAQSLTDDQALVIAFGSGTTDAEGYQAGAAETGPPTVAVQTADGTGDLSAQFLVGSDPADPLTFYGKRAPFVAGDTANLSGQVVHTFGSGAVFVTPFSITPGAATGITESDKVVSLSAIPATVVFPAPSPGGAGASGSQGV